MKIPYLFSAALAALSILSCERENIDTENKPVNVNVTILGTAPTRATSATYSNESKVGNLHNKIIQRKMINYEFCEHRIQIR